MADPPELPFLPYPKTPRTTQAWGATPEDHRRLARVEWVATEKIHGANLSLLTDGVRVRAAKRKAILDPGDDFFAHRAILERLAPALRALFARVAAGEGGVGDRIGTLLVHGEIFGGGYPHPDVAPVGGVRPVQSGVWYTPGVEFLAFDLAVLPADPAASGPADRTFVDHATAARLSSEEGVGFVEPLFVGSLTEALARPVEFETTIPARLGLPPLPDNPAEGIVVKPAADVRIVDVAGRPRRPVVKKKPASFDADPRFHRARPWSR